MRHFQNGEYTSGVCAIIEKFGLVLCGGYGFGPFHFDDFVFQICSTKKSGT